MKIFFCPGFILLLAMPLHAETYSWVDDSGTYNFTEDYSRVPKKFQKKAKRREDLPQDAKPQLSPDQGTIPKQADKAGANSGVAPDGDKEQYGGKSRAAWRKEMEVMEAELSGIEQHMEQVRKQIIATKGVSNVQFDLLKKDYEDSRAAYEQKYKSYNELIETVRKAGIQVEIKK